MPSRRLVVLATAACCAVVPSSAAAQQRVPELRLNAGVTALELDPAAAATLSGLGITTQTITGARRDAAGAAVFRITSGSLLGRRPSQGIIRHNGGLRLLQGHSDIRVDLNNLRVNDGNPAILTTQIGSGRRINLARMNFRGAEAAATRRRLAFTDVRLTLTPAAATALNTAFSTTAFAPRQRLGTLTTVARFRVRAVTRR